MQLLCDNWLTYYFCSSWVIRNYSPDLSPVSSRSIELDTVFGSHLLFCSLQTQILGMCYFFSAAALYKQLHFYKKKTSIFGETFSLPFYSRRCYPPLFVGCAVLCSSGLARQTSLCYNSRHLDFTSSYHDEMLLSDSVKTRTAPPHSFGGHIFSQCFIVSVCLCSPVPFVLTCSGFIDMHFVV